MDAPAPSRWSTTLAPGFGRVLVMKWSALGDVALATTVMQDLALALPGTRLDLDTLPSAAALFRHDPRFGEVLAIDVRAAHLGGMARWLARVAARRYDAIVDLQSTDRSRLLLGALVLTGRAPAIRVGNHRHWPYTAAPPAPPPEVHALEHLRATLRACGVPARTRAPVLHPGPEHRARVQRVLDEHRLARGEFALLMPGCQAAGWLKRWGWRRYAALAVELARRGIPRVVLVGAGDEREECDALAAACGARAVNLCGTTELLDLVPLAGAARCVIANDTGTAHVAAAAGRPMVVVCGPTDPRRVRPAGERVATLQAPLWCRNCYRKQCSHHSCMQVVDPSQALEALARLGAL